MVGSSDFLSFVGAAGFDFFDVAVAVESDDFDCVAFELAVGVEGAAVEVDYVGHDFEVLEVLNWRRGAFDFYEQSKAWT